MNKIIKVLPVEHGYIVTINNEQYVPGIFTTKEGANERVLSDAKFYGFDVILVD